ncbi:MAG: GntR family transcriptional regulator [Aminobacterium sp.]|uniref:GntR family transcriptional regulator n=1 Tax=Aminobacterium sp. TaxID=1872491 RepID=UPI001BCB5389|nr:FCD domain-containing protein [Aminobacterium sp.]MEA4877889.1 GntR family transcriptional regulator [Aminobacterium sp.]
MSSLVKASKEKGITAQRKICDVLRERILQGELRGGQQLRQDDIAKEFGVSRIPVREALIQLDAEGLVTFYPYKGAIVSSLSPADVHEIFTIRFALESAALRLAAQNMTSKDYKRIEKIMELRAKEENPELWSSLNWQFHSALYKFSRMPRLCEMIDSLHANIDRYLRIYHQFMMPKGEPEEAHKQIMKALKEGDTEQAIVLLEIHLRNADLKISQFLVK